MAPTLRSAAWSSCSDRSQGFWYPGFGVGGPRRHIWATRATGPSSAGSSSVGSGPSPSWLSAQTSPARQTTSRATSDMNMACVNCTPVAQPSKAVQRKHVGFPATPCTSGALVLSCRRSDAIDSLQHVPFMIFRTVLS